jgi:hypothetical protein
MPAHDYLESPLLLYSHGLELARERMGNHSSVGFALHIRVRDRAYKDRHNERVPKVAQFEPQWFKMELEEIAGD